MLLVYRAKLFVRERLLESTTFRLAGKCRRPILSGSASAPLHTGAFWSRITRVDSAVPVVCTPEMMLIARAFRQHHSFRSWRGCNSQATSSAKRQGMSLWHPSSRSTSRPDGRSESGDPRSSRCQGARPVASYRRQRKARRTRSTSRRPLTELLEDPGVSDNRDLRSIGSQLYAPSQRAISATRRRVIGRGSTTASRHAADGGNARAKDSNRCTPAAQPQAANGGPKTQWSCDRNVARAWATYGPNVGHGWATTQNANLSVGVRYGAMPHVSVVFCGCEGRI